MPKNDIPKSKYCGVIIVSKHSGSTNHVSLGQGSQFPQPMAERESVWETCLKIVIISFSLVVQILFYFIFLFYHLSLSSYFTTKYIHAFIQTHFISSCLPWDSNLWPWCYKRYALVFKLQDFLNFIVHLEEAFIQKRLRIETICINYQLPWDLNLWPLVLLCCLSYRIFFCFVLH